MLDISQAHSVNHSALRYRAFYYGLDYGEINCDSGANGVFDLEIFRQRCAQLSVQWKERAARYAGEERQRESINALYQSALYLHFSSLKASGDFAATSEQVEMDARRFMLEVLPHTLGCSVSLFEGEAHRGYLLSHPRAKGVVWIIGGLDSRKEIELFRIAKVFLQDGYDTLLLDVPGYGTQCGKFALADMFDRVSGSVIGELAEEWCYKTIFLCGLSLGGFLALRAAQDGRVTGTAAFGGFYDAAALVPLPQQVKEHLALAVTGRPFEDDATSFAWLSLAHCLPRRNCLNIHGECDTVVNEAQIGALQHWNPRLEILKVEGAEHVCTSRFIWLLPETVQWMNQKGQYHLTAVQ